VKHDVAARARRLAAALVEFADAVESARPPKLAVIRRERYVTISATEHETRLGRWRAWVSLRWSETGGKRFNRRRGEHAPWSQEWFVEHVRAEDGTRLSLREFQRYLQRHHTHSVGSPQDLRITKAIEADTARMRAAGHIMSRGIA
jgi:hypothetical protein